MGPAQCFQVGKIQEGLKMGWYFVCFFAGFFVGVLVMCMAASGKDN